MGAIFHSYNVIDATCFFILFGESELLLFYVKHLEVAAILAKKELFVNLLNLVDLALSVNQFGWLQFFLDGGPHFENVQNFFPTYV